jgi:hypothetical protein
MGDSGTGLTLGMAANAAPLHGLGDVFRNHFHPNGRVHVCMQMQVDLMLSDRSDGSIRKAHFAALNGNPGSGACLRNIHGSERAEQLPLGSGFGCQSQRQLLDLCNPGPRSVELLGLLALQFDATRLERGDVGCRG